MPISRQRLWQIERQKANKCQQCGQKPLFTKSHCKTCRRLHNNRRRKTVVDKAVKAT